MEDLTRLECLLIYKYMLSNLEKSKLRELANYKSIDSVKDNIGYSIDISNGIDNLKDEERYFLNTKVKTRIFVAFKNLIGKENLGFYIKEAKRKWEDKINNKDKKIETDTKNNDEAEKLINEIEERLAKLKELLKKKSSVK